MSTEIPNPLALAEVLASIEVHARHANALLLTAGVRDSALPDRMDRAVKSIERIRELVGSVDVVEEQSPQSP